MERKAIDPPFRKLENVSELKYAAYDRHLNLPQEQLL